MSPDHRLLRICALSSLVSITTTPEPCVKAHGRRAQVRRAPKALECSTPASASYSCSTPASASYSCSMPASSSYSRSTSASAPSNSASNSTTIALILGSAVAKVGQTLLPRLKLLAIAAVIIIIANHGALRHGQDEECTPTDWTASDDSCEKLLTNGSFVSKTIWQPHGCVMHSYTSEETKQCLKTAGSTTNEITRIVMIGDSRLRFLTTRLLEYLGVSAVVRPNGTALKHFPFRYNAKELHLQLEYHEQFKANKENAIEIVNEMKKRPPTVLVIGGCLHFIVDYGLQSRSKGIPAYEEGVTSYAKEVKRLPPSTVILYRLTEPLNTIGFHKENEAFKRNEDVDLYNDVALKVFNNTRVKLWHSSLLIALERLWDYPDHAHASSTTLMYDIQIILNLLCNRHMPSQLNNTCCTGSPERSNTVTTVIKRSPYYKSFDALAVINFVTGICFVVCCWQTLQRVWKRRRQYQAAGGASSGDAEDKLRLVTTKAEDLPEQQLVGSPTCRNHKTKDLSEQEIEDPMKIVWSLLKLSFILSYIMHCDRFDFFEKTTKQFSVNHFGAPLLVAICVAAFSVTIKRTAREQILARDFTDEWKGWMQYVLLVYHASGASSNLPIYMHVRVIVSSYLFLTGYGHFSRYWKTGSAGGFTRYYQVMYRLNFLTVLLCLVMDQPYMNYYFVVLVSFWYSVLHLVLALPPHLTVSELERTLADFARGALKIAMVAITIVVLSNFEVHELIFGWRPLRWLFQLEGHPGVQEWRFRWMLDRFSVLYGMIFALMCQAWTRFWPNNSIGSRWPSNKWGTALLAALSLSSFVCYPLLLQTCHTKQACNNLHPYFTWIPILGYIFFRHHSSFFRTHFSTLFAFLGQISLELYVSQYHILLASNTHSLLVLVPGLPSVNTVVVGLVFLCSAHEIRTITGALQPTLAPSAVKKMLRNLLVLGLGILLFVYWNSIG